MFETTKYILANEVIRIRGQIENVAKTVETNFLPDQLTNLELSEEARLLKSITSAMYDHGYFIRFNFGPLGFSSTWLKDAKFGEIEVHLNKVYDHLKAINLNSKVIQFDPYLSAKLQNGINYREYVNRMPKEITLEQIFQTSTNFENAEANRTIVLIPMLILIGLIGAKTAQNAN
jgi:hypothetical protein